MRAYLLLMIILVAGCAGPVDIPDDNIPDIEEPEIPLHPEDKNIPAQSPEFVVSVLSDFGNRIVYDTDSPEAKINVTAMAEDCKEREGTFDLCGSPCPDDAEACIAICAYTCEFEDKEEPVKEIDPEVQEKLDLARAELHEPGSSHQIFSDFPDVVLVYEDEPSSGDFFPSDILPFKYYYSEEANSTFNICGVERTVFICAGKLDREITKDDIDSGRCEITPIYLEDPRLGGSGNLDFEYLQN